LQCDKFASEPEDEGPLVGGSAAALDGDLKEFTPDSIQAHAKEAAAAAAAAAAGGKGAIQMRGGPNKDKPLTRRKSDLPADVYTTKALESHKRPDEYLSTAPENNAP